MVHYECDFIIISSSSLTLGGGDSFNLGASSLNMNDGVTVVANEGPVNSNIDLLSMNGQRITQTGADVDALVVMNVANSKLNG